MSGSRPALLARRAASNLAQARRSARFRERLAVTPRDDLVTVGDLHYGGYIVPASLIGEGDVCLHAGVGTDITFDLLMIARFGCTIHAVDPVPESAAYIAEAGAHEPRLSFAAVALWDRDEELEFHAPREAGYVSHSATDLHGTPVAFTAPARTPRSLMAEAGAERLALLKISAEGSEYRIVDHVLGDGVPVGVICVEYAQPAPAERALTSVERLRAAGWQLVAASVNRWNWKLTFVAP